MSPNRRSLAKFDAIVGAVRRELRYPFEALLLPPPRWEDQALLFGPDKRLIVLAGVDEGAIQDSTCQQVALREFVVAGEDSVSPLSEQEASKFAESVRQGGAAFELAYPGHEWSPQVARLIIEVKLAAPVLDNHETLIDILAPLGAALEARLIMPSWQEPWELDTFDPAAREFALEMSLFFTAELQLLQPLQEPEAVRRIRSQFQQCPDRIVGTKAHRWGGVRASWRWISFRVRQL